MGDRIEQAGKKEEKCTEDAMSSALRVLLSLPVQWMLRLLMLVDSKISQLSRTCF